MTPLRQRMLNDMQFRGERSVQQAGIGELGVRRRT